MRNLKKIIIIKRGIFAPNKYWSNLSNKYLKDGNGVNYFYENKKNMVDFLLHIC